MINNKKILIGIIIIIAILLLLLVSVKVARKPGEKPNIVIQTEVWTGDAVDGMKRDPSVYKHSSISYILAGTGRGIVEYSDVLNMVPSKGQGYNLKLYTPNGIDLIHKKNSPWGANFLNWAGKEYMYSSLQAPPGYDFTLDPGEALRRVYVYIPLTDSKKTAGGFPLEWKLVSEHPLFFDENYNDGIKNTYEGRTFVDGDTVYLLNDHARSGSNAVCMWSRKLTSPTTANSIEYPLLCPGKWLPNKGDWDINNPYPSELRGPIVEGAWAYKAGLKYYIFYSSGGYESYNNYAGFLAVCNNLTSPCSKILTEDKQEVKELIPGSSNGYFMIGRPVPVIVDNSLYDVFFHARNKIDDGDDILRCTNDPPLTDLFLSEFEDGGKGCTIGPAGPYCGNAVCDKEETENICPQDCGDCSKLISGSIKADKETYTFGETIAGNISITNNSSLAFTLGLISKVYKDNLSYWSSLPKGFLIPSGNTKVDLKEVFEVIPQIIPANPKSIGNWKLELILKAGKCEWKYEDSFIVRETSY